MKKRITAAVVCAAIAISVCGCGNNVQSSQSGDSTASTSESSSGTSAAQTDSSAPVESPGNSQGGMANPVVDCGEDLDKAKELAGFELKIPELSNYTVSVINNVIIEVAFAKNDEVYVYFRKSAEKIPNLSGINLATDENLDGKPEIETLENGVDVTVQKANDTYFSMTIGTDDGFFCVGCVTGLSKDEMSVYFNNLMVANIPEEEKPSGNMINPVVDCGDDLNKAIELTGFEVKIPELSNYNVSVIANQMIEVRVLIDVLNDVYVDMRMCKEKTDNMSGIYLGTDPVTETMNGVEVTAQKLGDSYYSLSLAAENGYFCVSCTSGMEKDTLYSYLESLYKANSSAADAAVG